ncbi:MAG: MATE family efflux transporter [Holosporales bacterium]|jgi:MATE family multidrug resistance protein|nr:MATE family efflux transporter [Holosporales bacterium]
MINEAKAEQIDCSWRGVIRVTLPAVLTAMSTNLMFSVDRFMLAGYSLDAMNAVTASGNFVMIFLIAFTGMSSSAETFVGQYNGAKLYYKLAAPVWQMIYLSLTSMVIFLPIAYFSEQINFLPPYYLKDGVAYQKIITYWSVLPPINAALSAFFIGQGKTKVVTLSVVIGLISNIALNYLLIYGAGNTIPRLGCRGAAIATVISEFVQTSILAALFLETKNRKHYKTLKNHKFNKSLFFRCCRIGIPLSLGNLMTLLAWYLLQTIMSYVSKDAATVYNIGINLYVFFIFVGDGINKAVIVICSNMIGRDDLISIEKVRRMFVIVSLFFGLVIAIPLACFPDRIISALDVLPDNTSDLYSDLKLVISLVAVNTTLETLLLSTWGILIAGGDTKYASIVYQTCFWIFVILPASILYFMHMLNSVPMIYMFITVGVATTWFIIHRRYRSLKWCNKLI